jgi:hypothetical protein
MPGKDRFYLRGERTIHASLPRRSGGELSSVWMKRERRRGKREKGRGKSEKGKGEKRESPKGSGDFVGGERS